MNKRTELELDIDRIAGAADPDQWLSVEQIQALADYIEQRERDRGTAALSPQPRPKPAKGTDANNPSAKDKSN